MSNKIDDNDFYLDIRDESEEYIIKSFANESRPIDKQMKVILKPLSGKDLNTLMYKATNDIKYDLLKHKLKYTETAFYDLYEEFSQKWEMILRIDKLINFKFKLDGEIKEFTDTNELYCYKNSDVALIVREIQNHIAKIDVLDTKN